MNNNEFLASIHNKFEFEVIDKNSNIIKDKYIAHNIILDLMWSKLCSESPQWNYCIIYGSGITTPQATDTDLTNRIGYKNSTLDSTDMDIFTNIFKVVQTCQLSKSDLGENTISEIGIGNSSQLLMTKALIQDRSGNNTSITLDDNDILTIYATVYVKINETSTITTPSLYYNSYWGGINRGICSIAAGIWYWYTSYGDSLQETNRFYAHPHHAWARFTTTSDTSNNSSEEVQGYRSYDVANKKITWKLNRIPMSKFNNLHGIKEFEVGTGYNNPEFILTVKDEEGSWYRGTQINGEVLDNSYDGTRTRYLTNFDFVKPTSVKIYVDGTEYDSSNYKVYCNSHYTDMGYYMRLYKAKYFNGYKGCCNWVRTGFNFSSYYNQFIFSSSYGQSIENSAIFENMLAPNAGPSYISGGDINSIRVSNDLSTWTSLSSLTSIPKSLSGYKYWQIKVNSSGTSTGNYRTVTLNMQLSTTGELNSFELPNGTNIKFITKPTTGSKITIDYFTETVAKDETNIFDLSFYVQFNEYTPTNEED